MEQGQWFHFLTEEGQSDRASQDSINDIIDNLPKARYVFLDLDWVQVDFLGGFFLFVVVGTWKTRRLPKKNVSEKKMLAVKKTFQKF